MSDVLTVTPEPINTGGKYLTFVLGDESYGIDVLKIREIIRLADITPVPQMPAYVRGVINLRGKIIPVLDLRRKFGLAEAPETQHTCIVVVQVPAARGPATQMGLMVDGVEEVVNIAPTDIEAPPKFSVPLDTSYLRGIAKVKGAMKILLDIDPIVSGELI